MSLVGLDWEQPCCKSSFDQLGMPAMYFEHNGKSKFVCLMFYTTVTLNFVAPHNPTIQVLIVLSTLVRTLPYTASHCLPH